MDQKTRAERFRNQIQNNNTQQEDQYEKELKRAREERIRRRIERMKRERQRMLRRRLVVGGVGIAVIILMIFVGKKVFFSNPNDSNLGGHTSGDQTQTTAPVETTEEYAKKNIPIPSWIDQQLLDVNEFSRPGTPLKKVKNVVIHWVANAGTSAQNNRSYFSNLADPAANPEGVKASSHFVVGLEGEIIQCVPIDEKSYCTNWRNDDTISIEVCHPDWEGKFNDVTYQSVIKLTAWLLEQFDLTSEDVIRHFDVTGKDCPKYYVVHEDAWEQLKQDVKAYMEANPEIQ